MVKKIYPIKWLGFSAKYRPVCMVWIAAVLAVFLFYKFVERPHKIIFFKIVGVLVIICSLIGAGFFVYEQFRSKKKYSSKISVEFHSNASKMDKKSKQRVAERTFKQMVDSEHYALSGLNDNELELAKAYIFDSYILDQSPIHKVNKVTGKETDDFIDDIVTGNKEIVEAAQKSYAEYFEKKLSEFLPDIKALRAKYSGERNLNRLAYIHAIRLDYLTPDTKAKYEKALNDDERQKVYYIKNQVELSHDAIREEFNKQNEDSEISFKICNKEDIPLNSYYFYVSGFVKGRSTPTTLENRGYGEDTRFNGDIIVKPNECSTITWTGRYRFFDRYEIKTIGGTWEE